MTFIDVPQNTDEWLQLRLGKATASQFGTFMANEGKAFGDPAKRYALQLALEISTGKKADFSFSTSASRAPTRRSRASIRAAGSATGVGVETPA